MKVTVVIPCFNEDPENLRKAVSSVRESPETEVIVVDDGSTLPQTLSALETLEVRVIRQENAGVAAARNAGIAAGQGQYILPLDSDDYLCGDFLKPLVEHMDSSTTAIATTICQSFGHKNDRIVPPDVVTAQEMAMICPIPNSSLFRRSDWESLGGYDETLRRGFEDWEWWARILFQTAGVARRVEGPEYMYRVSATGRNHTNYEGVEALAATRAAMVENNPGCEPLVARGLIQDLQLAYSLGQNQSPLAQEATLQAQYWAGRYGKLEGLRTRVRQALDLLRR